LLSNMQLKVVSKAEMREDLLEQEEKQLSPAVT
jgi:hypothetical protein